MRKILFVLLICLLLTACTVGVVKRQEPAPKASPPSGASSEPALLPTATEPEPTPSAQGPAWQVTIDTPENNAVLDVTKPIRVGGTGKGLFEGNVVVRALDSQGNVLAEAPTTVRSAEFSGEGGWQIELSVTVESGTPGNLVAFATSPRDGSVVASASVEVVFGQR